MGFADRDRRQESLLPGGLDVSDCRGCTGTCCTGAGSDPCVCPDDFARRLDDQISVRQPWCTCKDPYRCEGRELEA